MSEELTIALIASIAPTVAAIAGLLTFRWTRRRERSEGGEKAYEKAIAILKGRFERANDPAERAAIEQQLRGVEDDYLPYLQKKATDVSRDVLDELAPAGAITPDMPALSPSDREALEKATATIAAFDPPETPEDHISQGNAFLAAGELDKALAEYDAALELRPHDPDTLGNRGAALRALQRPDEALAAYNRALELRPDHANNLVLRGVTLTQLNRYEEALTDFNRSLELRPDHPNTLYNRACTLSLVGQVPEALEQLKEAISRDPKNRADAREDEDFANLRSDAKLGPEFERLVAEQKS